MVNVLSLTMVINITTIYIQILINYSLSPIIGGPINNQNTLFINIRFYKSLINYKMSNQFGVLGSMNKFVNSLCLISF